MGRSHFLNAQQVEAEHSPHPACLQCDLHSDAMPIQSCKVFRLTMSPHLLRVLLGKNLVPLTKVGRVIWFSCGDHTNLIQILLCICTLNLYSSLAHADHARRARDLNSGHAAFTRGAQQIWQIWAGFWTQLPRYDTQAFIVSGLTQRTSLVQVRTA